MNKHLRHEEPGAGAGTCGRSHGLLFYVFRPGAAPTFTQKPTIRQTSGKLLLECNLSAAPAPMIKWFKDETSLQAGGEAFISTSKSF